MKVSNGALPDPQMMLTHLEWIAFPALNKAQELRVEISWGQPEDGPNRSRTFGIHDLARAAGFAAWLNGKGSNVYVGVTLKCAEAPERGRISGSMAALATCLPVDIDRHLVTTAERLGRLVKPQLIVVTGRLPDTRAQLFIRIKATADLGAWEDAHERLVRECGGDHNALGKGRLMRLAGSISYPSPAKIARGYVVERTSAHFLPAPEYSVPALLAALSAPPAHRSAPTVPPICAGGGARRAKPPLPAVEAALRSLPDAYADQRQLWIKVGFALFDFDPGLSGMGLWQCFSQRSPGKASATDFSKVWAGFGRPRAGRCITINWLLREARKPSLGA